MICFPAILIFKLIKRFPILVLALYSTEVFSNIEVDKELEEKTEKVEYLESSFSAEFRSLYSDVAKATNNKVLLSYCELTPSTSSGFILTTSHKLYVLFSQMLLEQLSLNYSAINKIKTSNSLTLKQYNYGKYKENNRSEAISNSCNLLCIYHSNCSSSLHLINRKC